jgi:hypothetical protein
MGDKRPKFSAEQLRSDAIMTLLAAAGTAEMPKHLAQAVQDGAGIAEISAVLEATRLQLGPAVSGAARRPTSNPRQLRSAQS